MKLRLAIVAIVLIAGGVWLFERPDSGEDIAGGQAYPPYEVNLSQDQIGMLKGAALQDKTVNEISGTGNASVDSIFPWTEKGGSKLVGAVVELALSSPVTLTNQQLPLLLIPGSNAPEGTPNLHRKIVLSASNVSRLQTRIELDGMRVVQVIPARRSGTITSERLLGPQVGDAYKEED